MNKEVIELKQERKATIASMNEVLEVCKAETRSRTEEEDTAFTANDDKIRSLDSKIVEAERMEELNRTIVPIKEVKDIMEEKKTETFNLARAIKGFKNRNLSAFDAEMQEEGLRQFGGESNGLVIPDKYFRANVTTTTHADDINTTVAGLDVIATPSLYNQLGVTVWNGLKGNVVLNFSDGHDAAFVAEEGNTAESNPTRTVDTLSARRVSGQKIFSQEMLASSEVMATEFADMVSSIDRAISEEVLAQAVAANVLAGRATSDTAANITYSDMVTMLGGLETETFKNPSYAFSKPLYHDAEAIEKVAGSGRFIIENSIINGTGVKGTNHLPLHDATKYDVVYGDWSRAYVGFFGGGVELLVDPFSGATAGTVKIVFSRLADVAVNHAAFASLRNARLV